MATRKLTVDIDAKTDKAESKLKGLSKIEGSAGGAAAPDNLSKSLDKAAKSAADFDHGLGRASGSMTRLVRGFSGMAVGLAASYAAGHMQQGAARNAVEYGASALQGSSAGAMMGGPWGAVAGGAVGLVKTYLDKSAEKEAYSKDFETSERRYQSDKAWRDRFSSITSDKNTDDSAKLDALRAELATYKEAEAKIKASVAAFAEKGEYDNANHQRESLNENRSRQGQIESAIKSIEAGMKKEIQRTGESALDSLGSIGGNFAGAGVPVYTRIAEQQLDVLRQIEAKTGASPWQ